MRTLASFLLISGLFTASSLVAQTKITSVEGITEYHLDNGLQVLLFPDNSKPTVTVNVTYMVGSRFEGYGETGMAHLLEHMMFKGTVAKHVDPILGELNARGATGVNGSTDYDRTNYYETIPASDDNIKWVLEMEADRMVNSRVSRKDLDTEMTVVRNEFERGENSAASVLEERVLSTAYLWHSYGRSPIGSRSDIEHVPIEKLQAFYRNYYQPDNAMLVVAGKIDPDKTLALIKDTFGAIPKPARALTQTYTQEPTQDGEREVVLRRVGEEQLLMMAYHVPAATSTDSAALEVLSGIMSDQPAGRLYKALVESKKAVSAGGGQFQLHDPGVFLFNARVRKDGSLDDVEKTMLSVIEGVVKEPPSKEEVDRARTRILKNIELGLNSSSRVGLDLSEWGSMGDWRLLFLTRDRIEKVTPEDVARVAKQYLKASNRTIGKFLPEAVPDRAEIPPVPDIAAELKDYKGKAAVENGEAFDPSPANIEARSTRVSLPGGLKLVLLPKKTRGGTVVASLDLHSGDLQSLTDRGAAGQMTGAMLMRGTKQHSRQQIQDTLDKLKAQVTASGGGASISTVRASFADALRLAAEILKEPLFPEADFDQIRQANLARIESGRTDPQAMASNLLSRHLAPYATGDPRAVLTPDESIAEMRKVTLDDAKKYYADFFGASNAELVVVGDFDAAEVQKLATELFGSWKSPGPYKAVTRDWQKLEPINQAIQTPDKENAIFYMALPMAMNQDDPDYPALVIANVLTGGDEKSRLWTRVREKEGLSYSVQSSFTAGIEEKYGRFMAAAICAPQNIVKVETAVKEELARIVRDGFTAEEVEAAKKEILTAQQTGRAQDSRLASALATQARYGWTMQHTEATEAKIGSLTVAQVNAAAKKWIDVGSMSIVKAGDFKKAGVTP
ncbi:MAG TPA: pitrilysin family protein [Bryobacteraceae bacterium]|jgi:zinc protease